MNNTEETIRSNVLEQGKLLIQRFNEQIDSLYQTKSNEMTRCVAQQIVNHHIDSMLCLGFRLKETNREDHEVHLDRRNGELWCVPIKFEYWGIND